MPSAPRTPRPPRGPKAVRVDAQRILDAAQEVFAQDGLDGASIRSVARKVGCDPALIYYHFENKEALFTALLERKFPLLLEDLRRIAADQGRSTAERLWRVLRAYHKHLAGDAGFRAMVQGSLLRGAEGLRDSLTQRITPILRSLIGLVEEGIRRGQIRPEVQPMLCIFFLVRMEFELLDLVPVMGSRFTDLPPGRLLPLAERAWFETFWRGIAADPTEPLPFLHEENLP